MAKALPDIITKTMQDLKEEQETADKNPETKELREKLDSISKRISVIKNAKTLLEMDSNPKDAIKILEENGLQPILTESDKAETYHAIDYSSKSSLIGVYKTMYMPTENMIKTAKDAKILRRETVVLDGISYENTYEAARDTIHMTMNDEASSHIFGTSEGCRYAELIPFTEIPNEKIGMAKPQDTFIIGDLELTENAWILCPKEETEKVKELNPVVHVIGYDGESVKGFVRPFLTQLGYRGEDVTMCGWADETSENEFIKLMGNEGVSCNLRLDTFCYEDEEILERINNAVELSKLLRDKRIIKSKDDIKQVMSMLEPKEQGCGQLLIELFTESRFKDEKNDVAIKANNRQIDIFIEKMAKARFHN